MKRDALLVDKKGKRYIFPTRTGQYKTPLELERAASQFYGQELNFLDSNPRKKKSRRSCPGCGGQMSGDVCLTCLKGKNPHRKRQKNPIAIYNPKARLTKLPATRIEIRYQRTNGEYRGKWFKHSFKGGAALYGLPDGSLLLKSSSGRKLWGTA